MGMIREHKLAVMAGSAQLLNAAHPKGLELAQAHEAYAADRGRDILFLTGSDNVRSRLSTTDLD
jgi:hypothetical protein